MPKLKQKYKKPPLRDISHQPPNVLQTNRLASVALSSSLRDSITASSSAKKNTDQSGDSGQISSLLGDENYSPLAAAETSDAGTSELFQELDSFRQKWKRELEVVAKPSSALNNDEQIPSLDKNVVEATLTEFKHCDKAIREAANANSKPKASSHAEEASAGCTVPIETTTYAEAKRLFLIAVDMERDDMHHESIRFYKRAMHLCPDIEKQIFREQCDASVKTQTATAGPPHQAKQGESNSDDSANDRHSDLSLYERILRSHQEYSGKLDNSLCRPQHKVKSGTLHISHLPHELLAKIFRHVVGHELDLASLEQVGMVCKGFYLLSHDKLLWRDICFSTWGSSTLEGSATKLSHTSPQIDWRRMFLERPRVNFDGVYISRTRYFRQGDVGFQDITYRPFHVVRYYRYLRFFPDCRVLILTTNEEPEKIVPIFRHALDAKQFSPELSIMEGTYEFSSSSSNQISIVAEKKCRVLPSTSQSHRRQAQFHWSRQTPLSQKFNLKFELKTVESRPFRNNVLKWIDYTIVTRLESGQEVTSFDMSPDTFPNLTFSRVKRFNLRTAMPLSSH